MTDNRDLLSAALAAFATAGAIPVALAQLDFAGVVNAFGIDSGDVSAALLALAGISGFLTLIVVAVAAAGTALVFVDRRAAHRALAAASVSGFVTATIFWIPFGIVLGAAALMIRPEAPGRDQATSPAAT